MSQVGTLLRCGAALAAMLWCTAAGASPIAVVTEGAGPLERVVRFERDPSDPILASDARVDAIAAAIGTGREGERALETLNAGLEAMGIRWGASQFVGTLAEHALQLGGLARVNAWLTHGGLLLAGIQASGSLADDEEDDAAATSYKAVISFVISRHGWGALQVAGASLFLFDLTLSMWEDAVIAAGENAWCDAYRQFYREKGRTVNDWKEILWRLYREAERRHGEDRDATSNAFAAYVQGEVNGFVNQAFSQDPEAATAGALAGGLSGFAYGNRQIAETLVAEQREALEAMLAREVLPEIAARAGERQLLQLIDRWNLFLRPEMNRPIRLEVTFWGTEGAEQVRIPVKGGEWGGPLEPDGTFTLDFTRYAWLRAGLPDRVLVDTATGTLEAPLRVVDDTAIAVFGVPPMATISRYTLTEGPRSCSERRLDPATRLVTEILDEYEMPALGQGQLDTATLVSGQVIGGRFDAAAMRWEDASPAAHRADRDAVVFGPPRVGNLAEIRGCNFGFFTAANQAMSGSCTFVRRMEFPSGGTLRERCCTAQGDIVLSGVFADMGEGLTYHPMDDQAMRDAIEDIRQGMRDAGMDPDMFFGPDGTPGMITIPGMPQIPGMTLPMGGN